MAFENYAERILAVTRMTALPLRTVKKPRKTVPRATATGVELKKLRLSRGFKTAAPAAYALGISKQTLIGYENDVCGMPLTKYEMLLAMPIKDVA